MQDSWCPHANLALISWGKWVQDTSCQKCVRFLQDLARSFCMGSMFTELLPENHPWSVWRSAVIFSNQLWAIIHVFRKGRGYAYAYHAYRMRITLTHCCWLYNIIPGYILYNECTRDVVRCGGCNLTNYVRGCGRNDHKHIGRRSYVKFADCFYLYIKAYSSRNQWL